MNYLVTDCLVVADRLRQATHLDLNNKVDITDEGFGMIISAPTWRSKDHQQVTTSDVRMMASIGRLSSKRWLSTLGEIAYIEAFIFGSPYR